MAKWDGSAWRMDAVAGHSMLMGLCIRSGCCSGIQRTRTDTRDENEVQLGVPRVSFRS